MSYTDFCHQDGKMSIWLEKTDGTFDGTFDFNKFERLYSEIEILINNYTDSEQISKLISYGPIISIGKKFNISRFYKKMFFLAIPKKTISNRCLFFSKNYMGLKNTDRAKPYTNYSLRKLILLSYNTFFCNGGVLAKHNLILIFDKNNRWNFIPIDDEIFDYLKKSKKRY